MQHPVHVKTVESLPGFISDLRMLKPGAHPTRQPGRWPAHRQLWKAKGSTDSVGGPSRKIEVKGCPVSEGVPSWWVLLGASRCWANNQVDGDQCDTRSCAHAPERDTCPS
jgi:hypothetical protein